MDGNRRWARAAGLDVSAGHEAGARHLGALLGWLETRGIRHASVYVLSADNIRRRSATEVGALFGLIETVLLERIRRAQEWRLHVAGDVELLPSRCRERLTAAVEETVSRRRHLTLAIGYDPQEEIARALQRILRRGTVPSDLGAAITRALPGGPVKDIDLVIRTSGERRISGFFPWQSERAEIHFCDKLWPAFSEQDLDVALAEFRRRREAAAAAP